MADKATGSKAAASQADNTTRCEGLRTEGTPRPLGSTRCEGLRDERTPHPLELLAPARDLDTARAAVLAGADAVYIGAPAFGARAAATNSIDDIAALVAFAHPFRVKVFVTMNTILYDSELEAAAEMVRRLYAAGVDALIVQDMAYTQMSLPPIALHASTQCDIRTPEKARRLADSGFCRLVLPREFTLDEIAACRDASGLPLEVFVHGALCVSYSGDCHAGVIATGRSANRGECPQMCRLPYDLVDAQGHSVAPRRHYLSLRDMCRLDSLRELADAGACSFKIEGRLKDIRYVTNIVSAYSDALDAVVAASDGMYCRASFGHSERSFIPDVTRTFNRGYTNYFIRRPGSMASLDTPKWAGLPVGTVTRPYNERRRCFEAKLTAELANGDGLGYYDAAGTYHGFRLNRVEGNTLYPATVPDGLKAGMTIYRNADKNFNDRLDSAAVCKRTLSLDIRLSHAGHSVFENPGQKTSAAEHIHQGKHQGNIVSELSSPAKPLVAPSGSEPAVMIVAEGCDERGVRATVTEAVSLQAAQTPQEQARRRVLEKTGGTIYRVAGVEDELGDVFIPASVLTNVRRSLLDALDHAAAATYDYEKPRAMTLADDAFAALPPLTYHDNIANHLARQFYTSHGARIAEAAAEVATPKGDVTVMTTRYCIRRELGACLRKGGIERLPEPLFLRNESGTYRLHFDCDRCGMRVVKKK
ncbi:MAG: U32 family peptidase [Muribaculaceae bacterium]|nr:U32 family peptidase [Muribaculaceae bacterium]